MWVEFAGTADMRRFDVPELTATAIGRMAERVAGNSRQSVNEETPLLSAAMPLGERFQVVLAPAAPDGGAFSIRKHVISNYSLDDYLRAGAFDSVEIGEGIDGGSVRDALAGELSALLARGRPEDFVAFLKMAVAGRLTIVVSGGTSSGKTTFLNALLKEVGMNERVVSIEDTRELKPPQPNYVALVASKGDQGISRVGIQDLVESSLRLRPDRLFLGELRGKEAYSFLQAANTGHPGSLTTVHANDPAGAFHRLALMMMQAGLGLTKAELLEDIRYVVPVVVQLARRGGRRVVTDIYFDGYRRAQ